MIKQYTIKSFEDLYSLGWLLNKWIFRGQSDSSWTLMTKAERVGGYLELLSGADLEWLAVEKFQSEAQQYTSIRPMTSNRTDWLAFLQHHGGPTRLLDFTKSLYVSLYFALDNSYSDAIIWAVNEGKILSNLDIKIPEYLKGSHSYLRSEKIINNRGRHEIANLGLLSVKPVWMSQRQSSQQGIFLYPENLQSRIHEEGKSNCSKNVSFEENLIAEFEISDELFYNPLVFESLTELNEDRIHSDNALIRLIIPNERKLRIHLFAELFKMNITSRSLFPGLEGLAQSYNYSFEAHQYREMTNKGFIPSSFRKP